jgi:membrane protease YdiL (CAAX protease family)
MFRNLTARTKAVVFYALAFGLGLALIPLSSALSGLITAMVMFTPLLAVLLMQLVVTRDGYTKAGWAVLGLHRAGMRVWGLALLLPFLVLGFGYSVLWLTGIAAFAIPDGYGLATLPLGFIASALISIPLAFGEEIGWRGYLLPHLSSLGRRRALLLSGLLHGIWHLPILLLTPYYHSEGNPLIVTALFLATLTLAGVFYGYLRLTTGSVWPAVIAHGAGNGYWGTLSALTVTASPVALEYLAGESGLLPLLGLVVVAGWILYRLGQEPRAAQQPAAPRVELHI